LFDRLANGGEQENILEVKLGEAGGQQAGLFASRQTSLKDDPSVPMNDAHSSTPRQFLSSERCVGHGDLELLGQPFQCCQQCMVLHGSRAR